MSFAPGVRHVRRLFVFRQWRYDDQPRMGGCMPVSPTRSPTTSRSNWPTAISTWAPRCTASASSFDGSNAGPSSFQFHDLTSQDVRLGVRWTCCDVAAAAAAAGHQGLIESCSLLTSANGAGFSRAVLFCVARRRFRRTNAPAARRDNDWLRLTGDDRRQVQSVVDGSVAMRRFLLAVVMFGTAAGAQAADMPDFLRGSLGVGAADRRLAGILRRRPGRLRNVRR